jgi:hypothetical protein
MQPDPAAALDANVDGEDEDEEDAAAASLAKAGVPPELGPEVQRLMAVLGKSADPASVQAAVRKLTPEQREAIARATSWAPKIKRIVIGFVVVIVLFQVIGFVVALGFVP